MFVKFTSGMITSLLVIAGILMAGVAGSAPAHAHSNDWAAPFMGGIMAGHVLSNIQEQKQRQTQAMEEMARGGGGYGGGYGGYGGGYGRPAYGPPPQYGAPVGCR